MRQAMASATGNDETEYATALAFHTYRATLHAAFPGPQRKASAGWDTTEGRVQGAVLRSLKRAKRRRTL
jgi:hypothetical protein